MLLRKPKTLQLCWPEASLLVNYETDTLPLLFSSDEDYIQYYNAMAQMHSRKGRLMEQVRRLTTSARQEKENGNPIGCVDHLAEACDVRCKMFAAGDYQITAAVEHCIWSQIHLATLLLTQGELTDAHHLFTAASERIKEVRPKPTAKRLPTVNGGTAVTLPKRTINRLSLTLHNNWSNYWARRGKWNAALQHTSKAKSLWETVVAGRGVGGGSTKVNLSHSSNGSAGQKVVAQELGDSYIASFMGSRVNVALCGTWDEANLRIASDATSSVRNNSTHLTFCASGVPCSAMMEETGFDRRAVETSDESRERLNTPGPLKPFSRPDTDEKEEKAPMEPNGLPLDHLAAQGPGVTFRLVTIEVGATPDKNTEDLPLDSSAPSSVLPPFEITLCLDSTFPDACTTWPAHVTALFVETYCSAFAGFALRKYDRVEKCLASCARIASKCAADCNLVWWKRVQAMYLLLQDAPGVDQASGFRMSRGDIMQNDVFGAAKVVRDMVVADAQRGNGLLGASRSSTPAGITSSFSGTLAHRPFSPMVPSKGGETASGSQEEDWIKLTGLFSKKAKAKDALKIIKNVDREIATPLQYARRAHYRKKKGVPPGESPHQLPLRPATVAGFVGESQIGDRYRLIPQDLGSCDSPTPSPSIAPVTPHDDAIVPNLENGAPPPGAVLDRAKRMSVTSQSHGHGSPYQKNLSPEKKRQMALRAKAEAQQRNDELLERALTEFEYGENKSATRVRRQLDAALNAEKQREANLEKAFDALQTALGKSRQRREELEVAKSERIGTTCSPARVHERSGVKDTTTSDVDATLLSQDGGEGVEMSILDLMDQEEAEHRQFTQQLEQLQDQRKAARQTRRDNQRQKPAPVSVLPVAAPSTSKLNEQPKNNRRQSGSSIKDRKGSAQSNKSLGRSTTPDVLNLRPGSGTPQTLLVSRSGSMMSSYSLGGGQSPVGFPPRGDHSSSGDAPPPPPPDHHGDSGNNNSSTLPLKRFESGYKLNVGVDQSAEDAKDEDRFQGAYTSTVKRKKSLMVTDQDTGIVSAMKQSDIIPQVSSIIAKQKRLRSLLPAIDHRTDTYRMVMRELAENEAILKMRRQEFSRQKLEKNAEKVARKAGMVSVWRKLVEKKATERRATIVGMKTSATNRNSRVADPSHAAGGLDNDTPFDPNTWSVEEMNAVALAAAAVVGTACSAQLPPASRSPKRADEETPTGTA